jgi:predicted metal-dependent HD superfamily phosphohydrolase
MLDRKRWNDLWTALGAGVDPSVYDDLVARHGESHRAYHDASHVNACLAELDRVRDQLERPNEVELAFWFHDAIYDTHSPDNEKRSAEWAQQVCLDGGLGSAAADRVYALIIATRHGETKLQGDSALLVDIDLSILGRNPELFDRYEEQIRCEYEWVPIEVFRSRRVEILEQFLARERLYQTESFRVRYEAQARENIRRSIERLRS